MTYAKVVLAGIKGTTGQASDFVPCTFTLNGVVHYTSPSNPTTNYDNINVSGSVVIGVTPPSGYVLSGWYDFNFLLMGSSNPVTMNDYASLFLNKYGKTIGDAGGVVVFYAYLTPAQAGWFDIGALFTSLMPMVMLMMVMGMVASMTRTRAVTKPKVKEKKRKKKEEEEET